MDGGRGELCSGETRPRRRRRKNDQWPSPTARLAQLEGRRGRGGHGGALVELWFAFLRRRAGASSAEQQATAVASQRLRRSRVERMEQGRSRGERGHDVER